MLKPMEPEYRQHIDESGNFFFQIKWDGIRLIADMEGGRLQLYTRKARLRTLHYPELVEELNAISCSDFIIDGELIAVGPDGLPDFQQILKRDLAKKVRSDIPLAYMAFDCLRLEGQPLEQMEIEERQSVLHHLLETIGSRQLISECRNFDNGIELFQQMQQRGMEGVVSKRRHSPYLVGRKTPLWQKTKCWRELDVRAQAVNYRDGRPVSVAVTRLDGNVPLGSVSSGLSSADWRLILKNQEQTNWDRNGLAPLAEPVSLRVRFLEWTHEGHLRAPVVLRIYSR
ncbi:hypothetical protein [Alicyclobacillus sp. SO9]|uniref:ATP-dependent DNA ligase n=1 Tax=Alicyclobacillus sp. SO9 TaxID=2665646 RepID=UPI0018E90809|nr:hypothetical protein [Alicyclobacillus sp. SO9]QQE76777.1 hypothetical protein GI364_12165 [Alicyclobacillus sp. SO9]